MPRSLYLPIVTADDVAQAAKNTIALWADTYVAEIGRQKNITLPPIKRYGTGANPTDAPEEFPACIVTAPGLLGDPERRGDGTMTAPWALGVGIVVKEQTLTLATRLASIYIAAIRALLVQQGSLGGFAVETTWTDEEVAPLSYERDAVVVAGTDMFRVLVPNVVSRFGGPPSPPVDPSVPVEQGEVASTGIDVRHL